MDEHHCVAQRWRSLRVLSRWLCTEPAGVSFLNDRTSAVGCEADEVHVSVSGAANWLPSQRTGAPAPTLGARARTWSLACCAACLAASWVRPAANSTSKTARPAASAASSHACDVVLPAASAFRSVALPASSAARPAFLFGSLGPSLLWASSSP